MPNPDAVLQIALPLPLPRLFEYLPPPTHRANAPGDVGRRVRVPFGPRELVGVVVAVGPPAGDARDLREIIGFLDDAPLFHGELSDSLQWLSRYTHAPLGEVAGEGVAQPVEVPEGPPLVAGANGVAVTDYVTFLEREKRYLAIDAMRPSWLLFSDGFAHGPSRVVAKRLFDIVSSSVLLRY